jgi:hypothetical protein
MSKFLGGVIVGGLVGCVVGSLATVVLAGISVTEHPEWAQEIVDAAKKGKDERAAQKAS